MARTKATFRRLNWPAFVAALGQKIGNKNVMNIRQSVFKIKTLLPQFKQVEVKKKKRSGSQRNNCLKKIFLFFWEQKA